MKGISVAPIYRTRWERRALYNNTSNALSLTHTHARTHARSHARTRTLARTHTNSRTHARTHTQRHARTHARAKRVTKHQGNKTARTNCTVIYYDNNNKNQK